MSEDQSRRADVGIAAVTPRVSSSPGTSLSDQHLAGIALVAALLWACALPWLLPVDRALSDWLHSLDSDARHSLAFWLHRGVLISLMLLASAALCSGGWRHPRTVARLGIAVGVVAAASELFKMAIERRRPWNMLLDIGNSFPSGHVMNTTAVAVAFCVFTRRLSWPRWAVRVGDVVAVTSVLCEAVSRLLRSSHWFSDIPPSMLFGGGLTLALASLGPRLERRWLLVILLAWCSVYLIVQWLPSTRLHLPSGHQVSPARAGLSSPF